jgi:glutathione S-transferase
MIRVYYAPPSIFGRKVLAVLEEKGLDYEIERLSFGSQDHLKPDYLKVNPNGEIPALVDEDFTVYESTAIIEYLNDEYPEPPLLPEDSAGRARARMAEDYCDLHLFPALVKCLIRKIKKEEVTDADKTEVTNGFQRLVSYLGNQQWIAGKFSLADCAAMTAVATAEALEIGSCIPQSKPFQEYVQRLKKRPGYKGANLMRFEPAATA